MGKDIKNLMDDIIKDTDKRYNDEDESCYEKFDKDDYREKLSMFVLKDIISAMMANETDGLDGMIDESIMKHIHDDYKGTCFGYLCNARDKCKSPLLAEIIQEIESKTCEAAQECAITKNHCIVEAADVKKMLEGVEDYDQFIQKIASEVSEKVVDDVAGLLTDVGGKAPTFKDLDEKIELTPEDNNAQPEENAETPAAEAAPEDTSGGEADSTSAEPTEGETPEEAAPAEQPEVKNEEDASMAADMSGVDTGADTGDTGAEIPVEESVILTMCGNIVLEYALAGTPISTDEGLERAIVQFCLSEMDYMFKQPSTVYKRYLKK